VEEIFQLVGLDVKYLHRYPHEFSGGQRQRIITARALVLNPELVICDEPVSALDVSVRAQVLNLLQEIQEKLGLSYLFISHDLSVVRHISSRVAVMYLGRIVEIADKDDLYENPLHPYTKALLSAILVPGMTGRSKRIILRGEVPSPIDTPSGCCFHTRCEYAAECCRSEAPALRELTRQHSVACHFVTPAAAHYEFVRPDEDVRI
jgi:oligopeptide/dipeptide ABC transporter ATP-binding protein